jgi:hypothetical protein
MPPLYRKIKSIQLRQAWSRDPNAVLARYREALNRASGQPAGTEPSVDEMIDVILDREEADHSTSMMMRAIAA